MDCICPLTKEAARTWRNRMPINPVDVARYFSKVAAFRLTWVASQSLHVSVTCTTKGVFVRHGGACEPAPQSASVALLSA